MTEPNRKRRLCSHDMAEVPPECFWLDDPKGQSYFCGARCLCLWSVQFATKPNLPEERKKLDVDLVVPGGGGLHVMTLTGLAWWAVENALGRDDTDAS